MARSILVVRLGALGDLVHALPAVAAIRAAWPEARIDWLVDGRYAELLELVPVIDRTIIIGGRAGRPVLPVVRALRRARYDLAIDFQGLLKSAALARFAGARETAGFIAGQLREPLAGLFYTRRVPADDSGHVVRKNLSLVEALGVRVREVTSPLKTTASPRARPGPPAPADRRRGAVRGHQPRGRLAEQAVARGPLRRHCRAPSCAARRCHHRDVGTRANRRSRAKWPPPRAAPRRSRRATSLADLVELARAAAIFIAGDTGPMQLAAAVGTPVVGVFGPTNPAEERAMERRRRMGVAVRRLRVPPQAAMPARDAVHQHDHRPAGG